MPKVKASRKRKLGGPVGDLPLVPSAQTLLRWNLLRMAKLGDSGSALQIVPAALRPLVLMRTRAHIHAIEEAEDAEDVIALAAEALGAAEQTWHVRLRQFGPPVVPLLAHALRNSTLLYGERRNHFVEHLVAAFYWFGDSAAAALLGCLDTLDDYGKSLSCVVLGLLGHKPAAGRLWDFLNYARAARKDPERLYVGPLWGLIDLDDARAADAIASLLGPGKWFYELPDFVALAGDLRCVEPVLMALAVDSNQEERQNLMMALACILQRSGTLPFASEVKKAAGTADAAATKRFVEDLEEKLVPRCEDYLDLIRQG